MKSFQIINVEVATVCFAVTSILWDKSLITGANILDLSNRFMFYFLHWQIKANINLEVLYSDSDYLDFFYLCDKNRRRICRSEKKKYSFGFFFNYTIDHFLFSNVNKKIVLKFKDEAAGKIIEEIIASKPKLYSLTFAG